MLAFSNGCTFDVHNLVLEVNMIGCHSAGYRVISSCQFLQLPAARLLGVCSHAEGCRVDLLLLLGTQTTDRFWTSWGSWQKIFTVTGFGEGLAIN